MSVVTGWKRLYHGETQFDFIGRRRTWFALSVLLLAASIAALVFLGLNYGIEFKGGVQITAPIASDSPLADASDIQVIEEMRAAVRPLGGGNAQIQVASDQGGRTVLVQTDEADPEKQNEIVDAVAKTAGATVSQTDSERIGGSWGGEITAKALRALVIFLIAVVLYIAWRFELKMAIASIVALIHDLVITAGVYAVVGFEVTPSTVVAILTILGYSLYDTVVVFDKVEENTALLATTGRMTYQEAANLAMNQVFMRSLNTSLSTLLPVSALLFVGAGLLGATTLEDLALALFVGILVGTYSSIFVATPVLSIMKEREPRYRSIREKVLRDARRQAKSEPAASAAPGSVKRTETLQVNEQATEQGQEQEPAAIGARVAPPSRPPARQTPRPAKPRAGSRKRKRRR
jgi:preprotein translocase subunit SecF